MLSIKNKIFGILSSVSLLFMAYSGYIKWIPGLFIDPFIFFIILLFGFIILSGFRSILNQETLAIGAMLFSFFIWAFISSAWGTSNVYYIEKIQKSVVILLCFFIPFFVLRTRESLNCFINLFHFITFLAAALIVILFIIYGDLFFVFYGDLPTEDSTIPDYLALGVLLASGFILAIQKSGKVWLAYKTIVFIAIILLAPRGPLLTLVFFILVYYVTNRNIKFKWYTIIYCLILALVVLYFSEGLTARLFSRFSEISDSSSSAFSSVGSRIELAEAAADYFRNHPLSGIGYGSFGIKFSGLEDRIEPHNIIFEIAAETGIIGLFLFMIFIIFVFYYAIRKKKQNDTYASTLIILITYLIVQSLLSTYLIDSKALFFWLSFLICYLSKPLTLNNANKIR